MFSYEEARTILTETSDVYATAEVYFEDFSGIEIPKIRKGTNFSKPCGAPKGKNASELPRSHISDKEWPGFIKATIKEWKSIFDLKAVTKKYL